MSEQVSGVAALRLANVAYERGKAEASPKRTEVSGLLGIDTRYELSVSGRWTAKTIGNLIRQLELYREWAAEDEAEAAAGGVPGFQPPDPGDR